MDFADKNLTNTSLRYSTLDNATFTNSNLCGCDLTGVRFNETTDIYSMRMVNDNQDGELYLYVFHSDGQLRRWNVISSKYEDIATFNIGAASICVPCFGLAFLQDSYISFTKYTSKGLELYGGAHLEENVMLYDIHNDSILYAKDNRLFLFNIREKRSTICNYPIAKQSKVVLIDDESVIILNSDAGLQFITKSNDRTYKKSLMIEQNPMRLRQYQSFRIKSMKAL